MIAPKYHPINCYWYLQTTNCTVSFWNNILKTPGQIILSSCDFMNPHSKGSNALNWYKFNFSQLELNIIAYLILQYNEILLEKWS